MTKRLALGYFIGLAIIAGIAFANPNTPRPQVGIVWYTATDPTTSTGVSAPEFQFLVRTDNNSLYYKSGAANTAWTAITGGGGGGGTVTSITCDAGLTCAPNPITGVGTVRIADLLNVPNEDFISLGGATNNDVDLWSGGPHISRVEIDPSTPSTTISGIVAGSDGDMLWLWNGGGQPTPDTITLLNDSSSSLADNRIWIADGKGLNIPNNDGVLLIYDGGFGWTIFGGATSSIRAQEFSLDPSVAATLTNGSTNNNYDPWGVAGVTTNSNVKLTVASSGTATITGLIAAGAPNSEGRLVMLTNVAAGTVFVTDNDSGSSGDNRILLPNGQKIISLIQDQSVTLFYDIATNFWRVQSYTGNATQGAVITQAPSTNPQQNWAPTGWGPVVTGINVTSAGGTTMCGLDASQAYNGQTVKITNFTGSTLLFADECAGSSPTNQFFTTLALQRQLSNYGAITFQWIAAKGWVEISEGSYYTPALDILTSLIVGTTGFYAGSGQYFGDLQIQSGAHLVTQGTAATLTCNGTGAVTCSSASCNDVSGTFPPNTGATACTITFNGATYTTAPSCVVSGSSTTPVYISARSAGAITINVTPITGGPTALFDYICTGH